MQSASTPVESESFEEPDSATEEFVAATKELGAAGQSVKHTTSTQVESESFEVPDTAAEEFVAAIIELGAAGQSIMQSASTLMESEFADNSKVSESMAADTATVALTVTGTM